MIYIWLNCTFYQPGKFLVDLSNPIVSTILFFRYNTVLPSFLVLVRTDHEQHT